MAFRIQGPFTAKNMIEAVRKWVDLLSKEAYDKAYEFTIHDAYYQWTPELIQNIIQGYGMLYEEGNPVYKVSDWRTATSDNFKHQEEVEWYAQPLIGKAYEGIGDVYFDLPLNGEWSDLTAVFRICKVENYAMLELNDIHVL